MNAVMLFQNFQYLFGGKGATIRVLGRLQPPRPGFSNPVHIKLIN